MSDPELLSKYGITPLDDGEIRKQCNSCAKELFLFHFAKDSTKPDGYRDTCNKCRNDMEVAEANANVLKHIEKLDKATLNLLDKLSQQNAISVSIPHAATLLEDIMAAWGGSKGFAQHLISEYLVSRPGSAVRQRYIIASLNFAKFVSHMGYIQQPLETMTDEQVHQLRLEQWEHYSKQAQHELRIINNGKKKSGKGKSNAS